MAALGRTDSLDPDSTCKGFTSSGVACRRALGNPPGPHETDMTKFYCWQHEDQAPASKPTAAHNTIENNVRSSIDTLMGRLGINDPPATKYRPNRPSRPGGGGSSSFTCCCFTIGEEDEPQELNPMPASNSQTPYRPPAKPSMYSNELVPSDLPPDVAKHLATELAKPLSEKDEDGYIYIFWLTPVEASSARGGPPSDIASSILPGGSRGMGDAIRVAQDFNASGRKPDQKPGTIRLKIGRANNVHRRMNEWSKQCAHDVTLLRYYPYLPSSQRTQPVDTGRMMPFVHRVEHLIHCELAEMRLLDLGKCQYCGKEHKEWFEVPANEESIQRIDGCIRKWTNWADSQAKKSSRR
ncbi:hypothetical protein ASPWEDRAFT_272371 [Aspergillus wentii DTO 134E9]|uniref:Bacteriophage T5 Orf172 DNA-binding domain-containing protein n=1 Tax=Aspergillus wentii DTO 134E9 TaxID=1073089 RepID=A0A1L9S331_ASPWE|nr:uncharacterized protein ASPWEDRAFT_272371 [Aspergillus wentii DTO 134E9]KAI9929912.1 hypothetical protein MW887_011722 [Aspergillus wentii]OJJ41563.1 hypothetical protein ASPWEDRAFT_272371 [Aspergillus wentii DTO 134E9]